MLVNVGLIRQLKSALTVPPGSTIALGFDSGSLLNAGSLGGSALYSANSGLHWGRDGVVQGHNLLTYSQDFSNAAWTKQEATDTIVGSKSNPYGVSDAYLFTPGTANVGLHAMRHTFTYISSTTYTLSVYVKYNGQRYVHIAAGGGALGTPSYDYRRVIVDLGTGTSGSIYSAPTSGAGSITPIGNGWYRVSMTFVCVTGATTNFDITAADPANPTTTAYAGDGVSGCYIWGAQLEQRSTASTYIPTTSAAVYLPRTETSGASGGCVFGPEMSGTNLLTYSQDFSSWNNSLANITGTPAYSNVDIAPDGTQTADKLIANNTTGDHYFYKSPVTANGPYTISVYAKAGEYTFLTLYAGNVWSWFNLGSGQLGTIGAGCVGSISKIGDSVWYKCAVTVASGAFTFHAIGVAVGDGSTSFAGNNSSGIYIWGAQLETGTIATSPIPTLAATVTRPQEDLRVTGAGIFNTTLGTEVITNAADREFSSDTGWWVKEAASVTIADGVCKFTSAMNKSLLKWSQLTIGTTYSITLTISGYSSGGTRVYDGIGSTDFPAASNGTYTILHTALGTHLYITPQYNVVTTLNIDNISVKPVTGSTGTVSGWVNVLPGSPWLDTTSSPWLFGLVSSGTYNMVGLYKSTNTIVAKTANASGTASTHSATTTLTTGWHHLALTYDATALTLYIDGVAQASPTATPNIPSTIGTTAYIGADYAKASASQVNAPIDSIHAYPTALTAAQITALYRTRK